MKVNHFLAVLGLIALCSCKKGSLPIKDKGFDVDKFVANLKGSFDNLAVGYSFSIAKDGKVVRGFGFGDARIEGDNPQQDFTEKTRIELASSTKAFACMALLKAMEKKNIKTTDLIYKYLPTSWKLPVPNLLLTFEDLLRHKSGLINYGADWEDLKKTMETARNPVDTTYDNVNYYLIRVMLPYITWGNALELVYKNDLDNQTRIIYKDYVREEIFKPSGLQYWNIADFQDWHQEAGKSRTYPYPLYYNFDAPTIKGASNPPNLNDGGGGGMVLNTWEMAQVLAASENKKLLGDDMRDAMKNRLMGWTNSIATSKGAGYWKGGNATMSSANDQGMLSFVMVLPHNIQVAFLSNSNNNKHTGSPTRIVNAYNNAWVE